MGNASVMVNAKIILENKEQFTPLMEKLEELGCRWASGHSPADCPIMEYAKYIFIEKGEITGTGTHTITEHHEDYVKLFWLSRLPFIKPEEVIK
jgi:hypothetical protein